MVSDRLDPEIGLPQCWHLRISSIGSLPASILKMQIALEADGVAFIKDGVKMKERAW
jgi:hypothetical protein